MTDMGNEMGNSNVSGLQEQDNTEFETPIKSSKASFASVNEKYISLNSKDPSGRGDPNNGKEGPDKKDNTEIQAPTGSLEFPLVTNHINYEENQFIPSSKDDETDDSETQAPNGTSDIPLMTNEENTQSIPTSNDNEKDDSETRALKGPLEVSFMTNDEENQSVLTSIDNETDDSETQAPSASSEVQLVPKDEETQFIPTSNDNETDDSETQVPSVSSEVPSVTKDEETEFIPASNDNETDDSQFPSGSSEVPFVTNDEETQSIPTSNVNETDDSQAPSGSSEVPFVTNDEETQSIPTSDVNETDDSQAPSGYSEVPFVTNDEETESIPTSHANSPKSIDQKFQKQLSIGRELNNINLQVSFGSSTTPLLSNETSKEPQSVPSSGGLNETVSASGKDPSETSVNQIQKKTSVRRETGNANAETQLVPSDLNDEHSHLVSPKDDPFGEEASASEKNPSGAFDQQLQNQTLISRDREGEQMINSSLDKKSAGYDPEVMESVAIKFDPQELVNIHDEPHVEEGSRLQGSNVVSPHDSDEEGKKLEHEIDQRVEGSINPASDLVECKQECETQKMEKESQEKKSSDVSNTKDISSIRNDGKEELNLLSKCNTDSQEQIIQSAKSLESLQVEILECKEKPQVLDEETKLIKSGSVTEQSKQNPNPIPVSEGSKKESNMEMMETATTDLVMIEATNDDEKTTASDVNGLCNSRMSSPAKETANGCQVDFHDSNMNSACQGTGLGFKKITKSIVDSSGSPNELTTTDIITEGKSPFQPLCDFTVEVAAVKPGDPTTEVKCGEVREIVKQISIQSDHIEPAESSVSNYPVSVEKPQEVIWDLSSLASEMAEIRRSSTLEPNQENSFHKEPKNTCNLTNSTVGHDSHTDFPTAESKDNSNTRSKQENVSSIGDIKEEYSFDLGIPISKPGVSITLSDRQDSEHNSTPQHQITDAIDGNFLPVNCDFEPKQIVNRFTTESNSENLKSHAKATEASNKTGVEDSDQSPLLYQEDTVAKDVFELKSYSNETLASKVSVTARNAGSKREFTVLNSSKEECDPETLQDQEFSAEKQVIPLEHSDLDKLKTPLLSFMKEETNVGSQMKQENPVGKKAVEDKRNSDATEIMDTPPPAREKRKIKASFFSNCMCCTAVIQ